MNNVEFWSKWTPENIEKSYCYIDSICSNKYGLTVILVRHDSDQKKEIHVKFFCGVYCYRDTYETYVDTRMSEVYKRQESSFFRDTNFFKVTNSNYIKWVSEQSGGISDYQKLEHYVIFTGDKMVEILSTLPPKIEFVDFSLCP